TRLLCEKLASLARPPKVLVCASAVGYYGPRGDTKVDESSDPGQGFLAEICKDWEAACSPARAKGIRVVNARIGVVLSPQGGALAKMLLPFKMGVGGVVGSGEQYMSWVALDDVVGALHHALITEPLSGPVNVVAPAPVTNYGFTKILGKVLGRPTVLPMPAFMARLAFGEMADELLLTGQRVEPKKLLDSNYAFRYPDLEGALRHLLGKELEVVVTAN
ncbi:MAG: TIGR01777 family oxidoreductase, partial [Gemmataceae bacterium]